jgi:hypothetical protein
MDELVQMKDTPMFMQHILLPVAMVVKLRIAKAYILPSLVRAGTPKMSV